VNPRIHLAEIGYVYQTMPNGIRVGANFIAEPRFTLCKKPVPATSLQVLAPHDERTCGACVAGLPQKTTDHVRALLFPS
jgi:hypothetical protein